ncbi:MAG: hypothetical protein IJF18_07545 [Oscillospiraceae bacterium]|nr:hypothetical protein [Oscillospiraceae bacterium]
MAITINEKNRSIVLMGKEFAKAASQFGTPEYADLQAARRDYPNYKVVVKNNSKSGNRLSGLTYAFMEKYIKSHGTKEEIAKNYDDYKEQRERGECYTSVIAYGIIKDWFLEKYPEIEAFGKKKSKANNNSENESTEITLDEKKSA